MANNDSKNNEALDNTDTDNTDDGYYSYSWQSGIKFVEEKRSSKILKYIAMFIIITFSATVGGIIGGYYVKKNYDNSTYDYNADTGNTKVNPNNDNLKTTITSANAANWIPENSITAVAGAVGPAIVGVENSADTWAGNTIDQDSGSGIIIDDNGFIVTSYHVVENATKLVVSLPGGKRVNAKLVGTDQQTDIAVIHINAVNLPKASFGDSSNLRVGDVVVAIGNPLGEEYAGSVTSGVVSALNRKIELDNRSYKLIQTDASINPGNSGGALCDLEGNVIGINAFKLSNAEGIGFAIPINEAKPIIKELIKKGYVSRPTLGIRYQLIDKQMAEELDVPTGAGIIQAYTGEGAQKAGIKQGDIIVELDKHQINDKDDLTSILSKHGIGDVISSRVYRTGKYLNINIVISDGGKR